MDPLDLAIHATAHEFKGGVPALAKRTNIRAGTLQNKADPGMPGHRLNVYEARAIMLATGDTQILRTLAHEVGEGTYPLGECAACSDEQLLQLLTQLHAQRGKFDQTVQRGLEDGKLTASEYLEIERHAQQAISAALELLIRLRKKVENDQARHLALVDEARGRAHG